MNGSMKGLLKEAPGMGAVIKNDLKIPETGAEDVLVKVHWAAICGTDQHIYFWSDWAQQRIKLPMVFGHEFSGEVVEVGRAVTRFSVGDRVAGETHIPCKKCHECLTGNQHNCEDMKIIGVHVPGAFCEYIAVPQDCVWKLNDAMDYKMGALLEPMGVAVHGVFSGEISRKSVMILGCGPIGLMAVAVCAASGAANIVAIDILDKKLELAEELGANITINTKNVDLPHEIFNITKGQGVDVIIDYSGNVGLIANAFKALKKGGRFTLVGLPDKPLMLDATSDIIYKEAVVNGVTGRLMYKTWFQCNELLTSGTVDFEKIVGGVYSLEEFDDAFSALKNGASGKMMFRFE